MPRKSADLIVVFATLESYSGNDGQDALPLCVSPEDHLKSIRNS